MNAQPEWQRMVRGSLDADGRLIEADPPLAELHRRAGGKEGGALALPQIAGLARLSKRLGITISRGAMAADGDRDLELWVRAEPVGDRVELSIGGWNARPAQRPIGLPTQERETDFARAAADWAWETDERLRFTGVSPVAAACLEKLPEEVEGQQLTAFFRFKEEEDGALPILNALAERVRFEGQLAEVRGGAGGTYRLSGVPLIDGMGKFAGFRGSAAKVLAAEAGRDQPADEPAFDDHLDNALREPLDQIISHAEKMGLQREGPLQSSYAGYASDIATAARHLLSLIEDLVDLQAIERADFKPVADPIDLADVARRAAALLEVRASARGVHIVTPAAHLSLPVTGEYRRALQILMNLLTNAIRYSPEAGKVHLVAERMGGAARIIVCDEGKGIAPEDQTRVFEKFERVDHREEGGTGLGLYIARKLARAMGGDLQVESGAGEGARFIFSLPLRRDA